MWKSNRSEALDSAGTNPGPSTTPKPEAASGRNGENEVHTSLANAPRSAPSTIDSRSHIGSSLQIKGEIWGSEDLQLDCSVEGTVRLPGRKLAIGANAKIVANLVAGEVIVLGNVKGNVTATDRIEIKKDGSVAGELTTSRIMIEDGAYFKGTIAIDRKGASASKEAGPSETPAPLHISGGSPTLYLASAKDNSGA